jgi:uncharacterized protein (TIGR00290 family)
MKKKAALFWSGGKDSAFALYKVLCQDEFDVQYLVTTIHAGFGRISMHGVRTELVDLQSGSIGIPLLKMFVQEGTNVEYETLLLKVFEELKAKGINDVIYGDIFLEDLRRYRDGLLQRSGMKGHYPLWKKNTSELIRNFLSLGFRTMTCCVSNIHLDEQRAGVEIDEKFISSLPATVDPCGENGEFHTFCFAGPVFKNEIEIKTGEKIFREIEVRTTEDISENRTGFWYADLLPA